MEMGELVDARKACLDCLALAPELNVDASALIDWELRGDGVCGEGGKQLLGAAGATTPTPPPSRTGLRPLPLTPACRR